MREVEADQVVALYPQVNEVAEVISIRFKAVPSPAIYFPEWKALVLAAEKAVADHPDLAGIVILHGTATLEETAYAVQHLTVDGFSIAPGAPRTPGLHAHVSFQLAGGLSISFEVVARTTQGLSGLQRFDFVEADPDLIELLLTTAESDVIH